MKNIFLLFILASLSIVFSSYKKKSKSSVSKTLAFPVSGKKSNIGSLWGVSRDGGKRTHEGIDIFARKGTPVIAICDGVIASMGNGGIGGKALWLQSDKHPWTAYYAHLDKFNVRPGQVVRKGQVIGTVGNTGNAKHTPAHLHFGIYNWKGPVNPLPYVKNSPRIVEPKNSEKPDQVLAKTVLPEPTLKLVAKTEIASPLEKEYVWKTINMISDPRGKYYVTTGSNVVRSHKGQLQLLGKWMKSKDGKFPFAIHLQNKTQLLIDKAGKLLTPSGQQVGTIS